MDIKEEDAGPCGRTQQLGSPEGTTPVGKHKVNAVAARKYLIAQD
jgi:hypothetical protein